MFMFLISLSWTFSLIFCFLNHPLSFGFIILSQTILISLISGILNLDYWFSYIIFLIMIGGMLVLFIYMTSIASNEKFKFKKKLLMTMIFPFMYLGFSMFTDNFFMLMNLLDYDSLNQTIMNINMSMNKYMNMPSMLIMITMMIYLLITLIAIVKITQSKMGPLRPFV
uniref:NADH dehydrogenase subunit 6 n=1 Tax=Callirhopalus sedakowii TaxID=2919454 RepID=UPI00207B04D8|nr:NADH dehydrogenase subunit 6 [Callirhopalus sedakowii]URN73823.1 NADH dehydrogenase subunit 6 [Callirhopalus sedakowii]